MAKAKIGLSIYKNTMKYKIISIFLFIGVLTPSLWAQSEQVTVSGLVKEKGTGLSLPFVNVVLKKVLQKTFVMGTITNEQGQYILPNVKSGQYILEITSLGFNAHQEEIFVGNLSNFLDLQTIELAENINKLNEVVVKVSKDMVGSKMDKKIFSVADNIAQSGSSVLQAMQNLPSVTVQDGKIQLRGSDKVMVLIDGKQTGLTGFGTQSGLDNIPASAIEKIEIINNPSAKYDSNGNAGIINIIYKKNKKEGFNGKIGLTSGLGALWERKANLPTIRPQYSITPKINPSLALNYRKDKINAFFQGDYLYTQTLNKNEFVTRIYDNGDIVNSQLKRNRNTHFATIKTGLDWNIDDKNTLTASGLFGSEKIIDRGDQPFFNSDFSVRRRLWQFLEDELKTTVMATAAYQHKFSEPGRLLNAGFNYTFHREDEKYFYDNILIGSTGTDAFKLLSDESVFDLNLDYIVPLKHGRIETGIKFRKRDIPTNMDFQPGQNSVIDANAGGPATYKELIPAVYGNYVYENLKWEAELGLRLEYVDLKYEVNPNHNTYKSDGYSYTQPFPNMRLAYKFNDYNKLSVFFNRRVDRPNEVDIRIFPKYDDAEIIKVGNPMLRPQFTNSLELGYKTKLAKGNLYTAFYHRIADGTITRISSTVPGSQLIYATFQNVNKSYNSGVEMIFSQDISSLYSFNVNMNGYRNQIDAFTVENRYPVSHLFSGNQEVLYSGNLKWNNSFHFPNKIDAQLTTVYLAPDIIPQGKIQARFSVDFGLKKAVQKGKGEVYFNATDLFNTLIIKRTIQGDGFRYTSNDYYETQVFRFGYSYKF